MSNIPARANRTVEYPDIEEDDSFYPQRLPTSSRRYTTTQGQRVIQQGNRRIVIHDEPPPKRGNHWLLHIGIGMLTMLLIWFGVQLFGNWWIQHQEDSAYGMPRTYQTDQVVGHSDSTAHPTHFIFENLAGHVVIIELPGGNIAHARIYSGPTLFSDSAGHIPVTAEFTDVNNDGRLDIVLHIQDQRIVYLNDGTQFKPQQ
ncbi:MAG: hypothetical protein AUH89_01415 [Ktedonobacter sp. 13_1_40CM_4_52_4]|nr:MAG: hypothetical protein AUH89_01415 [Ktedonobacter sp. 13_1_40CM_4_52_4]